MLRLRHVVHLMTNAVIVGSLLVFVLVMGWVSFVPIAAAIVLGFLLAWPASILVARMIKTDDPAWSDARDRPVRAEFQERLEHGGRDPLRPEPPNPLDQAAGIRTADTQGHRLKARLHHSSAPEQVPETPAPVPSRGGRQVVSP